MYQNIEPTSFEKKNTIPSKRGFIYDYPVVSGFIVILLVFVCAMMYVLKCMV